MLTHFDSETLRLLECWGGEEVPDASVSLAFGLWQEENAEDGSPELADREQNVDAVLHGAQHGQEGLADDGAVDHRHEDCDALAQTSSL